MEIITTTNNPPRNAAQNNPGCLVERFDAIFEIGSEVMAYYHPNGIAGKITIVEGGYLSQVEATRSSDGEFFGNEKILTSYGVAIGFLVDMIEESKRFIERG